MTLITRSDIPACYLFCLEMYGVLDEYLKEVNNHNCFWRRKAKDAEYFSKFIEYSFYWHETTGGFFYWYSIANQEK